MIPNAMLSVMNQILHSSARMVGFTQEQLDGICTLFLKTRIMNQNVDKRN